MHVRHQRLGGVLTVLGMKFLHLRRIWLQGLPPLWPRPPSSVAPLPTTQPITTHG